MKEFSTEIAAEDSVKRATPVPLLLSRKKSVNFDDRLQ
jgi:hypothetical protein